MSDEVKNLETVKASIRAALDDPRFTEFVFYAYGPGGQKLVGEANSGTFAVAGAIFITQAANQSGL